MICCIAAILSEEQAMNQSPEVILFILLVIILLWLSAIESKAPKANTVESPKSELEAFRHEQEVIAEKIRDQPFAAITITKNGFITTYFERPEEPKLTQALKSALVKEMNDAIEVGLYKRRKR